MVQMAAAHRLTRSDHKARISVAWLGAVLGRVAKVPPLEEVLAGGKAPPGPEELQAHLRAMASIMPKRSWEEWQMRS